MTVNPFSLIYRSKAYSKPYAYPLAEFPLIVDIEVTNDCNLDCLMCSRQIMTREVGYMNYALFSQLINEVYRVGSAIRLIRWGEPFLHPEIYSMIAYTRYLGIPVHVTTNGLAPNFSPSEILDSKLSSITFSFQGTNKEEYQHIRNNKGYDLLVSRIRELVSLRETSGLDYPYVQVTTTILDESEEQVKGFSEYWKGIVDGVDFWYTSLDRIKGKERVSRLIHRQIKKVVAKNHALRCKEVLTKLSVNWNGDVTACCGDYDGELVVGSVKGAIKGNSLREVWTGDKLNKIRTSLSEIPFCSLCAGKF